MTAPGTGPGAHTRYIPYEKQLFRDKMPAAGGDAGIR